MPSEIFAFVQAQPQAQTPSPAAIPTAQTDGTETLPGLFDSLITQYISPDAETINAESALPLMPEIPEQTVMFTGSNSFSRTIIDMLAGDTEPEMPAILPEAVPENPEAEEEIIWFENTQEPENIPVVEVLEEPEAEIIPASPEDTQPKPELPVNDIISRAKKFVSENPDADIDEVISFILSDEDIAEALPEDFSAEDIKTLLNENHYDDSEVQTPENSRESCTKGEKIITALTEYLTAPKEAKPVQHEAPAVTDDDDTEDPYGITDTLAISDTNTITAGLAIVPQTAPEAPITASATESPEADTSREAPVNIRDTLTAQPQPTRTARRDNTQAPDTQPEQETLDTPDTQRTFRETLEARTAQHKESEHDTEHDTDSRNQGQDFGQAGGDSRGNSSRPRTDTRRTERTDRPERAETSRPQNDRTTATHRTNSFQSFFEGVMNSRRTPQSSAIPMNLRETYNFTQAQTLRNGLVNVVRFIRADGVQKATVVVDPPALGRISVELTSGTSGVEATIKVASEQIRQLVQDQLSQLRMNLSRQGVQVAEFTVDVQQDNSHNHSSQDHEQEQRRVNITGAIEEDEPEEFRVDLEEGLLYWLA